MTQTGREIEAGLAAEPLPEMPLPTDPKTIFLGGLFVLALLAAAYVASEIVLPVVFAFTLKLLLQPLQRLLERLKIPRALAAVDHPGLVRNNRRPGDGDFGPRRPLGGKTP